MLRTPFKCLDVIFGENLRVSLKIAALVFFAVLTPVTLWNAGHLYLAQSCDPKFGCIGVFQLLTFVASICAGISALSVFVVHYIFVVRRGGDTTHREIALTLLCFVGVVSIVSGSAIGLAEALGVGALASLWAIVSFLIGIAIFKFGGKI